MTIEGALSLSLTSKCQLSPEKRLLDLESAMRGPDSIPTEGEILSLDFFVFM